LGRCGPKTNDYEALFGLVLLSFHHGYTASQSRVATRNLMLLADAPRWLQVALVVSISIGPLLAALRAGASPVEKFVCVTLIFPLVLPILAIAYIRGKKAASHESNLQLRENRLEILKREFVLLLAIIIPASLVVSALIAWLLFVHLPDTN